MFWKFDLNNTSHIDQLLDREGVTLRELMEEEDVLQECKAQNRKLLLFLSKDHCMQELVTLITEEPPADLEEKTRFKFPNIACELLTSDVALINDKLGGDESLLEKLYHFLEQEPPLNPLLASFFSKTIGNLIARKTDQVISFLRKKHNFISLVLNHIDASAMMDLLLRLISCVEPAPLRMEVLNWLNEERLIQRLTELMHTGRDEERQSNASQTLCDIIRLSRDQANQLSEVTEPDPLLAVLESQENVAELLKNMFEGERTEASVVNGTQVLLTLLESRRSGLEGLMDLYSQGCERSYTVNSSILCAIEPHLKDFQQLLLNPPTRSAILTTVGVLEQPLGSARLHVARLVASLLQTCDLSICQEICRLNTMDLLLDLFFKYSWNNFLHLQVELCVASILNHSAHADLQNPGLQNHEERPATGTGSQAEEGTPGQNSTSDPANTPIQDALVANVGHLAEGGRRRGNMGHLTRIANTVVQNLEKGLIIITCISTELPEDCRGRWESFVGETLRETNRRNTVDLAFSDYQIQQMTANFVDQFGFNDEEFSEHDENINAAFDRIAEINFNIDADDHSANAAAFEACCKERIQQFDDCEEEEDIWDEKEINYATQIKSRSRYSTWMICLRKYNLLGSVTGAWEGSPGQKAPLVASDSSSSGGSDSEEDAGEHKTVGSSKTPANQTTAPLR
uniref:Protein phosphatase 6, regulatory subunit 2a n=1 Tax=Cyprinus carpio TaxID=7962 RepID=A0A8C2GRW6_CYPCA